VLAARYTPGELLQTGLLLVAAVVIMALGVWLVRRWWIKGRGEHGAPAARVWSLQDLREMRAAGQITEAEFAALKERLVSELKAGGGGSAAADSPRDRRIPPGPA